MEKDPATNRLKIIINKTSKLLEEAKQLRSKEEEPAVSFVFKYGLALAVMGLLDSIEEEPGVGDRRGRMPRTDPEDGGWRCSRDCSALSFSSEEPAQDQGEVGEAKATAAVRV